MTDWGAIQRALLEAIQTYDGRLDATARQYVQAILETLRAAGYVLDATTEQRITDYLDAVEALLRESLTAAVAPLAAVAVPAAGAVAATLPRLRDDWIQQRITDAYGRRWPDGLQLSERVWRWQEETRRGVSRVLNAGVRLNLATERVVFDLQRAIESSAGERFARVTVAPADWADRLSAAARGSLLNRGAADEWAKAVAEAREHIDRLQIGGTRRQAEAALTAIRRAVRSGQQAALDAAMDWWLYDRQLYAIRRVVRTEMATAHHRAVIASTEGVPEIVGYRWRLSPSHPIEDICDWYAGIDFGLGAGVWPVDQVPTEKAHPHCMCSLTPTTRRQRADGEQGTRDLGEFLAGLSPRQMERIAPAWARALHAEGVPWSDMLRPDGRWLDSQKAVRARLGLPPLTSQSRPPP